MDVRQLILDRLAETGRSRYWLAETCAPEHSLHPQTVYRYLRGAGDLTGANLEKLMAAVGLQINLADPEIAAAIANAVSLD